MVNDESTWSADYPILRFAQQQQRYNEINRRQGQLEIPKIPRLEVVREIKPEKPASRERGQ